MKYEGLKINKESVDKLFPKQDINVLGYESPIKTFTSQLATEISKRADENIWEAVVKTGVVVDKDELIKALQYDRDQYEKGYRNGYDAGYRKSTEVAEEIFAEIEKEIESAIESNYRAKKEHYNHSVIPNYDNFTAMCDGKIYAMRGVLDFIAELKKKYTEEGKCEID